MTDLPRSATIIDHNPVVCIIDIIDVYYQASALTT